jgi:hypothetical protein
MRAAEGVVGGARGERILADPWSSKNCSQRKLRGIPHPIRRCHSDVFQYIFEWAADSHDGRIWFAEATSLSSACSRRRKIALNTSYLWIHIDFPSLAAILRMSQPFSIESALG